MDSKLEALVYQFLEHRPGAEAELVAAFRKLAPSLLAQDIAGHSEGAVRLLLARALASDPSWKVSPDLLGELLGDPLSEVRRLAIQIGQQRQMLDDVASRLRDDDPEVRRLAFEATSRQPDRHFLQLMMAFLREQDQSLREYEARLLDGAALPSDVDCSALAPELEARLQGLGELPSLARWVAAQKARTSKRFGTDLSAEAEAGRLPRAYRLESHLERAASLLEGPPPRALVLRGESGVGKTALVQELVQRLLRGPHPWRVLRMTPSDFLVGTKYLGEWQTKLDELVEDIGSPRRVLLYVPNLEQLHDSGRADNVDSSVAEMLAPHIQSGRITILGETTPAAWRTGLGRVPSLARLFTPIELSPASLEATRDILQLVAREAGHELAQALVKRLIELADIFLQSSERPGRALGLLRQALLAAGSGQPTLQHVLAKLSDQTGLPLDLLDDGQCLDLARLREFFEARVMGQPEALERVVDLVTLIKAGLTDPGRPYGVFLFVGPTGVGKTELARALAEYLFGDPGKLLRFDMSEYASWDSAQRLIGVGGRPGTLTDVVHDKPFSVVLLDEIEKAHPSVYDLCLQVFDAGRLTDGRGRTTSFKNTILILTSNLGSTVPVDRGVGFAAAPGAPPDRASILGALREFFRPEFLNRIDHVVCFDPLRHEIADRIARREVARVIERSGIARRDLTIDVDPGVYAFLLERGYSAAYGARPLKRTVETHVLLPLARAIAEGKVRPGSLLQLRVKGKELGVRVLEDEPEQKPPALRQPADLSSVQARVAHLRTEARALEERKSALLERSSVPGFWDDRPAAGRLLDELHRLERLLSDLGRLEQELERTTANQGRRGVKEFIARHDWEASRLAFLFGCGDLSDAFLVISRVNAQGGAIDAVEQSARLYSAFARRHRLECEVLDDRSGTDPAVDTITLAIGGPGALALLSGEAGLHQWTRAPQRRGDGLSRELVRIEVLRVPDDDGALDEARLELRPLRGVVGRVGPAPQWDAELFHAPSRTGLRAWCAGSEAEVRRKLHALLRARLAAKSGGRPGEEVVRRFDLGSSPLVRDRRSGLQTGHVQRVLRGELELVRPHHSETTP